MSAGMGVDYGANGAVAEMDEALGQVDRLLRQMANCPGGERGYTLCRECRKNAHLMRARIREVRGFKTVPQAMTEDR